MNKSESWKQTCHATSIIKTSCPYHHEKAIMLFEVMMPEKTTEDCCQKSAEKFTSGKTL
jgi:hypothetical protein